METPVPTAIDAPVFDLAGGDALLDVPLVFEKSGKAIAGFKVVGANSQTYMDADRKLSIERMKRSAAREGKPIDMKTDDGAAEVHDAMHERHLTLATACIKDWYGFVKNGEKIPLDAEEARKALSIRPMWLTRVIAEIEGEKNFIGG
jgi:hypothetical protein